MRLSAGFLCVFTSCLPKLTLTTTTAGVRTGNQPQDGWQGCGDTEIQGAGSVRGPVSASTGEASLVVVYVIESVMWSVGPLSLQCPSASYLSLSSLFLPPQARTSWFSILDGERGRANDLTSSTLHSWESRCSLNILTFPCRRNHGARGSLGPELGYLEEGAMPVSQIVPLILSSASTFIFFCFNRVGILHWKFSLPQRLSFMSECLRHVCWGSWTIAKKGWSQFLGHHKVHS